MSRARLQNAGFELTNSVLTVASYTVVGLNLDHFATRAPLSYNKFIVFPLREE